MRKLLRIAALMAALIPLAWISQLAPAQTIQTKPRTTTSWYVNVNSSSETDTDLNSWMYATGNDIGQRDWSLPGQQHSVVIFDFGQPWVNALGVYGTTGFPPAPYDRFTSVDTIRTVALNFAFGYLRGASSDTTSTVRMVIGTNNYGPFANYAHGEAWANTIKAIGADLQSHGWSARISVRGGTDAEPNYSTPALVLDWLYGYASAWGGYWLYDYGSANGCPKSGTTNNPGACNHGWTQDTVQNVAWGTVSFPVPEIYNTIGSNAKQWQQLSLYSYLHYSQRMTILAPLSEKAACDQRGGCVGKDNTPAQAWDQLWTALNSDPKTAQNLSWSTDIKWRH